MKKQYVFIITVVLCVLLATGCNSNKTEPQNGINDAAQNEVSASISAEPTKSQEVSSPSPAPSEVPLETPSKSPVPAEVDACVTQMPNGNNINFGGINFYIPSPEYCSTTQAQNDFDSITKTWTYPLSALTQSAVVPDDGIIEINAIGDSFAKATDENIAADIEEKLGKMFGTVQIVNEGSRSIAGVDAQTTVFSGSLEDGKSAVAYAVYMYNINTHTYYTFLWVYSGSQEDTDQAVKAMNSETVSNPAITEVWEPFNGLLDSVQFNVNS